MYVLICKLWKQYEPVSDGLAQVNQVFLYCIVLYWPALSQISIMHKGNQVIYHQSEFELTYPEDVFLIPHEDQTQLCLEFDIWNGSFNCNASLSERYRDTRGDENIITVKHLSNLHISCWWKLTSLKQTHALLSTMMEVLANSTKTPSSLIETFLMETTSSVTCRWSWTLKSS